MLATNANRMNERMKLAGAILWSRLIMVQQRAERNGTTLAQRRVQKNRSGQRIKNQAQMGQKCSVFSTNEAGDVVWLVRHTLVE